IANTDSYVTAGTIVVLSEPATLAEIAAIDAMATGQVFYGIGDTYANLLANTGGFITADSSLFVTEPVTFAEAFALQDLYPNADIEYEDIADTTANTLAAITTLGGSLGETDVILTDAPTLAQLATIDDAITD